MQSLVNNERGRWGDGEMGRWGDGEMGRWGDGAKGRLLAHTPQVLVQRSKHKNN
ncbi:MULTISPECIES: hypothetical protein [unclassified Okeania]|uniref:hypothetical protein n=1 Tax=unclassified Okeania TaxID=2634635 RepID=UPI00257CB7EF|nr:MULTISPECIES: hypothetical protein [unclassified Okeania]